MTVGNVDSESYMLNVQPTVPRRIALNAFRYRIPFQKSFYPASSSVRPSFSLSASFPSLSDFHTGHELLAHRFSHSQQTRCEWRGG